jgi:tRNA dimethylallyltransferase
LQYVIRALEVKILTGKSKKDFRWEKKLKYDILFLTPYNGDREFLYNRINTRVKMMFDEWLVEEVKKLRTKYSDTTPGLWTIWYVEVVDYLKWKYTIDECLSLVQQHNRNYAKRQLTWFRKYEESNT